MPGGAAFTFGDMVADEAGFAAAISAAVDANVRLAGEAQEEHFTAAAALLRSLPGLAVDVDVSDLIGAHADYGHPHKQEEQSNNGHVKGYDEARTHTRC